MAEAAACRDFGDAYFGPRNQQFFPRQFKASLAQEVERRATQKSTKVLLQNPVCQAGCRGEFDDCPTAARVPFDQIESPL